MSLRTWFSLCLLICLGAAARPLPAASLCAAAAAGDLAAARALIAAGTPVDERAAAGVTPLLLACREGHTALADYLLSRGAEANVWDAQGETPLHAAARAGVLPLVRLLVAHWAGVNAREAAGLTPLHCAAAGGHGAVATYLLQHGADPRARASSGLSVAHAAQQGRHFALAQALRSAAAAPPAGPAAPADYRALLIGKYPFYRTSIGRFAPIYPALARQIVMDYGVKDGVCVDIGGGCGALSQALVKITNLKCYMLDIDPAAVRLCGLLAAEAGLSDRVIPIEGDAMALPFKGGFADLVVSRGSLPFWPSQLQGVREAYRILKPGGVAYLGGGFGRLLDKETLEGLKAGVRGGGGAKSDGGWRRVEQDMVQQCQRVGITQVRLLHEPDNLPERGWWVEVRK